MTEQPKPPWPSLDEIHPRSVAAPRVYDHLDLESFCQGVVQDLQFLFTLVPIVKELQQQVVILTKRMNMADANAVQLQADIDKLKTDVTNVIASLKAQLAAALAAAGTTPPEVTAALQSMDAEVTALDLAVNPPAPVPAPAKP